MNDPSGRRPTRAAALVALGVACTALLGCAREQTDAGSSAERAGTERVTMPDREDHDPGYEARLRPLTCTDPSVPVDRMNCEALILPEDRSDPQGRQVELPVLRVRPATPVPAPAAPVVVLHGGPGGGVVSSWATWTTVLEGLGSELVLYDQRGGGDATPRLDCPEHSEALQAVLATTDPWEDERLVVADALSACHDRLTSSGVDLDQYDTPTSTRDLEDLRVALGAEQLTLVAQSYGTRLALDYLRTHPDRVRSLVLDGVDPPGSVTGESDLARDAVDRLVAACDADRRCAAAHPDLGASIDAALRGSDSTPRAVPLEPADGGPATTMRLTGNDLYAGLFAAMYDSELVPLLPSLVEVLREDGGPLLDTVSSMVLPGLTSTATGALMSVECADAAGRAAPAAPADDGPGRAATLALASSLPFCDSWPVEPVDATFADEVDTAELPPVLVVAGELDPITPAARALAVAQRLGATYVEVPRAGHSPMLAEPCTSGLLRSFLAVPEHPDLACVSRMRPRPFA